MKLASAGRSPRRTPRSASPRWRIPERGRAPGHASPCGQPLTRCHKVWNGLRGIRTRPEFVEWYHGQGEDVSGIPVCAILFGEVNAKDLGELAELTDESLEHLPTPPVISL